MQVVAHRPPFLSRSAAARAGHECTWMFHSSTSNRPNRAANWGGRKPVAQKVGTTSTGTIRGRWQLFGKSVMCSPGASQCDSGFAARVTNGARASRTAFAFRAESA
jgi:hypothetical protein